MLTLPSPCGSPTPKASCAKSCLRKGW
jgi:hypothetical protein